MDSTENQSHIAIELVVVGARGTLFGPARRIRRAPPLSLALAKFSKTYQIVFVAGVLPGGFQCWYTSAFPFAPPHMLSIFRGMSLYLRVGNVRCGRICTRIREWVLPYGSSPCRQTSTLIMPCFSLCFCPYPCVILVVAAAARANWIIVYVYSKTMSGYAFLMIIVGAIYLYK